jgi:hypothetical protein
MPGLDDHVGHVGHVSDVGHVGHASDVGYFGYISDVSDVTHPMTSTYRGFAPGAVLWRPYIKASVRTTSVIFVTPTMSTRGRYQALDEEDLQHKVHRLEQDLLNERALREHMSRPDDCSQGLAGALTFAKLTAYLTLAVVFLIVLTERVDISYDNIYSSTPRFRCTAVAAPTLVLPPKTVYVRYTNANQTTEVRPAEMNSSVYSVTENQDLLCFFGYHKLYAYIDTSGVSGAASGAVNDAVSEAVNDAASGVVKATTPNTTSAPTPGNASDVNDDRQ